MNNRLGGEDTSLPIGNRYVEAHTNHRPWPSGSTSRQRGPNNGHASASPTLTIAVDRRRDRASQPRVLNERYRAGERAHPCRIVRLGWHGQSNIMGAWGRRPFGVDASQFGLALLRMGRLSLIE